MGQSFNAVTELLSTRFSKFTIFLILQTFIQLISTGAEALGVLPGTGVDIWVQILVGLLSIWNFCYLVQVYKAESSEGESDFFEQVLDATYDSFSFLLYSLLYSLTIMVGGFLFVLPGIYCLIFHYFTAYAAVLKPEANEGEDSYLSFSRKIVKPHWPMVIGYFLLTIVLTMGVTGILAVPFFSEFRMMLSVILAPVDAFLILFADLLGIHFFHYLVKEYELSSENPL